MALGTTVGQGKYTYEVDKSWGRRDGGLPQLGVAQGVTGDSQDRVYIFQRSPTTEVLTFDRDRIHDECECCSRVRSIE